MPTDHIFTADVFWKGNLGTGTSGYDDYSRNHEVRSGLAPVLVASSEEAFAGDPERWNPEQLLISAVAQCHMLWALDIAARNGVVIVAYRDHACGVLEINHDGSGQIREVWLRPEVVVAQDQMVERMDKIHAMAHRMCFIARSIKAEVHIEGRSLADRRRNR
ncbi:MAG: peroxiredoxin [Micrococcales bacterium]|nr:MAG: peroxiredoxin [Micrococcales bacterium]PIE26004.1 MAG: peroxiredoxin [Micrococcales bacterium]